MLDGAGNVDEVTFPTLGYIGVTLRLYDKERDLWSLYWASSRTGISPAGPRSGGSATTASASSPPRTSGRGATSRSGILWNGITATSAHWEQAFSVDGGTTWEINWTADFTRTG